jgi:hypothetical protein
MSNTLAIAAVTSGLRYLLSRALAGAQPGPVGSAQVTTRRPDRLVDDDLGGTFKGVNVYLLQVSPNHAWNLADLPTRRADGQLSRRPVAALDLHYLISCVGDDDELDAQRLLARAVLALAGTPVLTRELIAAAIDEYDDDTGTAFLADADLAEQVEPVKLAPVPQTVEDLSRLWSLLGTPHQLSVTYTATVVLLEADVSPRVALPVRRRSVSVAPIAPPRIASADTDPPHGPVEVGTRLHLRGSGLLGSTTRVRVGPAALTPADGAAPDHLEVTVDATVRAGIHAVRVEHVAVGVGQPERVTARSNGIPVLVRPQVGVDSVTADTARLTLTPPLHPGQRAAVGLTSLDPGDPAAVTIRLDVLPPGAAPVAAVELSRDGVPDGQWLLRVTVDGAESLPQLDGETYAAPRLSLT